MANELALILKSPVEELIPKMIAWNNAELLARVEATLEQYKGVTYDDSQIATAKADRRSSTHSARLSTTSVSESARSITPRMRSSRARWTRCCKRSKAPSRKSTRRSRRSRSASSRKSRRDHRILQGDRRRLFGLIPYERIHNPKWLNASTTMKSVRADIDAVFENARNALVAIEALQSEDEELVKAFYFRTLDLSAALMEDARLKAERARVAEMKARQEQAAAEAAAKAAQETPQEQAEVAAPAPKMQVVRFQVEGTVEQLKALQRFLKENKIKFRQFKEVIS